MAVFSVLVLTAPPPTQASEAGGAFARIDGREAVLRSVELFLNRDNVGQIQLVVDPDSLDEAKRKYGTHLGLFGVKVLAGGPKWTDQLAAAGKTIDPACTHVLVHDAARPAVPFTDIDAVMECAETNPVVALVAPLRSQLVEIDEGGEPVAHHFPSRFMLLLSPAGYSKEKFEQTLGQGKEVHASEAKLVKGSPLNIRVGGAGEERLAKAMLGLLPKPKIKAPSNPFEEAQW